MNKKITELINTNQLFNQWYLLKNELREEDTIKNKGKVYPTFEKDKRYMSLANTYHLLI